MTADSQVAHGYTVRDLEHLTRLVLRLDRCHTAADGREQYDAVWFGITEYLLTAVATPSRGDLLQVGTKASASSHDSSGDQQKCRTPKLTKKPRLTTSGASYLFVQWMS
jgi:hypothetical protein